MPRQLEIRTTILAKKPSSGKGGQKDDNGNDVYADEALQLLHDIQQLKSDVRLVSPFLKLLFLFTDFPF